jgi:amidophosphoribosyltransferase
MFHHVPADCGIAALFVPSDFLGGMDQHYNRSAVYGVFCMINALQHRGEEGAGIAGHTDKFRIHRGVGTVDVVFHRKPNARSVFEYVVQLQQEGKENGEIVDELWKKFRREQLFYSPLEWLQGSGTGNEAAIGHTRYSTAGGTQYENAQPVWGEFGSHKIRFALAHNGTLTNYQSLREKLQAKGVLFRSSSDTEVIVRLIEQSSHTVFADALQDALQQIQGAYSLVILYQRSLFFVRDPRGIRPLVYGTNTDGNVHMAASESCAFDVFKRTPFEVTLVGAVAAGTYTEVTDSGLARSVRFAKGDEYLCALEQVYFHRADSSLMILGGGRGRRIAEFRHELGRELARLVSDKEYDVVVPILDSAEDIAAGCAEELGLPKKNALFRNRYAGRTFTRHLIERRVFWQNIKHNDIAEYLQGKRVLLVDDSLIRGNTSLRIIAIVRDAGAELVDFASAYPPAIDSCFWGMDFPTREELIAARLGGEVEAIRGEIGANNLFYMTNEGLRRALETAGVRGAVCAACILGHDGEGEDITPRLLHIAK